MNFREQLAVGDAVRLHYIMGEDGQPYLSPGTRGVVRGVYGRHALVERETDGELVDAYDAQEVVLERAGEALNDRALR